LACFRSGWGDHLVDGGNEFVISAGNQHLANPSEVALGGSRAERRPGRLEVGSCLLAVFPGEGDSGHGQARPRTAWRRLEQRGGDRLCFIETAPGKRDVALRHLDAQVGFGDPAQLTIHVGQAAHAIRGVGVDQMGGQANPGLGVGVAGAAQLAHQAGFGKPHGVLEEIGAAIEQRSGLSGAFLERV
jgi:hypothetical protein